ncbi:MAG: SDR family NAD(P)-dependent oxidoreductase [Pseudomonadota bacterium]
MMHTLFDLSGQTALVTGAGTGLGQQFAVTLAHAGADVVLAARRQEKLAQTASMIEAIDGRKAACIAMDVTDRQSVQAGFEAANDALAVPTIIVNNAGISRESFAIDFEPEDYNAIIDTNLNGVFWVAQAAAQNLVAAGMQGSVINISSILGRRVSYMLSAYSAAKAGVIKLTESLAIEWVRHGIRVNAIAPGFFVTDINREFFATPQSDKLVKGIPMKRPGELRELSGAMLLLASEAGAYMTGTTITVDGGHVCSAL